MTNHDLITALADALYDDGVFKDHPDMLATVDAVIKRRVLTRALEDASLNQCKAADIICISRKRFWYLMQKYGLTIDYRNRIVTTVDKR